MTIIKKRANFAELIAQAAKQKSSNTSKEDQVYRIVKDFHRKLSQDEDSAEQEGADQLKRFDSISSKSTPSQSQQSTIGKATTGLSHLISLKPPHTKSAVKANFHVSYKAYKIVESLPFRFTRFVIIALAFVLLGFDTVPTLREKSAKIALDSAVDVFFIAIGFMKFLSLHFRNSMVEHAFQKMSFMGMLKNSGFFNISISICSLIFVKYPPVGRWFRLLRVCVLTVVELNQIPQIDVLMSGMILGARSLASTWLLLSLVFLVYSTICVTLFEANDPFHFGGIQMAMWTFFELSTFDNWSAILYINIYGCDAYPAYYTTDLTAYPKNSTSIYRHGTMYLPVCSEPSESHVLAPVIFTSFILICGFILISLTVAAVTGGINDRLKCIEQEGLTRALNENSAPSPSAAAEKTIVQDQDMLFAMLKRVWMHKENMKKGTSLKGFERNLSMLGNELKSMVSFRKPKASAKNFSIKSDVVKSGKPRIDRPKSKEKVRSRIRRKSEEVKSLLSRLSRPSFTKMTSVKTSQPAAERSLTEDREITNFDDSPENTEWVDVFDKRYLGLYMRDLTHGVLYNGSLLSLVCVAAFLEIWSVERGGLEPDLVILQVLLQILFSIDIACRVLSHYPNYKMYLQNNWNIFDSVLVFLTWLPILTLPGNKVFGLLRVLRILRVLRLLNDLADLNIILQAIGSSASALFYVTGLMLLFFYIFAVAGVFLFSGNDYFHFGTLGRAFLCLYQISTLDDWSDIARTNMYGCDYYGYDTDNAEYDAYCESPKGMGFWAAIYFAVFIVFGVYVLLSLFVGIIITSMELLRESIKEEDEVWEKVRGNQEAYNWNNSMVENLLEIFNSMDIEQNGKLTLNELKPILKIVHVTETDQFSLFMKVDKDSSGQIDFAEFIELIQLIGVAYHDTIKHKKAFVPSTNYLKSKPSLRSFFAGQNENAGGSRYHGKEALVFPDQGNSSPQSLGTDAPYHDKLETLQDNDDEDDESENFHVRHERGMVESPSESTLCSEGSLQVLAYGPLTECIEEEKE